MGYRWFFWSGLACLLLGGLVTVWGFSWDNWAVLHEAMKEATWVFSHGVVFQVGKRSSVGARLRTCTASLPFILLVKASQSQLRFRGQGNTFSLLKGRASKILWPLQFTMVYFSSVCLLDCALLSFLTVPALNFLLSVDKATLYHTVPFISNSFFFSKQGKRGHSHS